jgi:Putative bacterial sensory transduction regulator
MSIEHFDTALIERYLQHHGWRFYRGDDGNNFLVIIATEHTDLHIQFNADGLEQQLFTIRVTTPHTYPAADKALFEELVATWNRDKFWPKAYLRESSDHGRIRVCGEYVYPLRAGIHWELFIELADTIVTTAADLIDQISLAAALPSPQEMNSWLRETG